MPEYNDPDYIPPQDGDMYIPSEEMGGIIDEDIELDKAVIEEQSYIMGKPSKTKEKLINRSKNLILTATHPSPLFTTRGFFGCQHFSKTNEYLLQNNLSPIDWQL